MSSQVRLYGELLSQIYATSCPILGEIGQRAVAQIGWAHHVMLMQSVKDLAIRLWRRGQIVEQGWSRDMLGLRTRCLPEYLPSSLPSIEEIEAELSGEGVEE